MELLDHVDPDINVFNEINKSNSCFNNNVRSMNNAFCSNNKTDLNVICYNIRSCNKNFDEFLVYIDSIKLKFDVIILVETWLTPRKLPLYSLEGYTGFHSVKRKMVEVLLFL